MTNFTSLDLENISLVLNKFLNNMTIRDWEGVALIIGAGDIGNCISDYLRTLSPRLDVNLCGRNLTSRNDIYLDLEDDDSFDSFENQLALFNKPLRLVISTSDFLTQII